MEIRYTTKEESNREQENAFLSLSPADRFYAFIDLMVSMKRFPTKAKPVENNNFIIEIRLDDEGMEREY